MAASRAVHLTKFGSAETVELAVVPAEPKAPKAGEILVKMTMAPVNPADIFSIAGVYPGFTPAALPAVPGLEGAGVVAAIGEGTATSLAVGQRVVPFLITGDSHLKAGNGSWADHVVVKAEHCIPVPDGVADEVAAQLVVNPMTAWMMLHELAVPKGQFLIQDAAGSVLGRQVIEMAKFLGVKSINVVRRAEQAAELLAIGADHVLCSATDDIPARVREITGGAGAYAGIDAIGGDSTAVMTASLRAGGRLLIYGAMGGIDFKGSVIDCLFRGVSIGGFWVTSWAATAGMARVQELAAQLWTLLADGTVKPLVGEVYPLERVKEAVVASTRVARGGKVLLRF